MTTLRPQFEEALTNIQINGEKAKRAAEAHTEVRGVLEEDPLLLSWGVDTKLIGSYARNTGIYPGKDVDIFVKLTNLDTTASPKDVFNAVWRVLDAKYGSRAKPQDRSIKVDFPHEPGSDPIWTPFAVDAVPAVRDDLRWAIPAKDRDFWLSDSGRWVTTDPEYFSKLSSELNTSRSSPTVGGRDAYVPVVKLMRQTRRVHLGDRRPGGLLIEFATYEAWTRGSVNGSEWEALFAQTLRRVAERLAVAPNEPIVDPALGTPVDPAVDAASLLHAAEQFRRLADLADNANRPQSNICRAATNWRQILGSNERTPNVFPLPPGCGPSGNPIHPATLTRRPQEAQGFG
ncbi:MAG: nucleotidyltransferase [Chloroflexi bacterium]|nr:nucleotidyltransferase [Chloroflexota bacterium]